MEHILGKGDSNWQALYIILREKGAMTINQYYFHALSRKRRGWFYFQNIALYLCHATANKLKPKI